MNNTRRKIKKTQITFKLQASVEDSDEQSSESGALIGSNDDLLTEIFLRVPATSIIRFKSVSKHWKWLLSNRRFTLRYDKLLKSPGLFLGVEYVSYDFDNRNTSGFEGKRYISFDVENPSKPPFRSLDFCSVRDEMRIIQSCNGLLLCRSGHKYYVFNPSTKQFAKVPWVPGGYKVRKFIRFMGLAFHPTDCVHYKVVCILKTEHQRYIPYGKAYYQVQIYSSDTGNWKVCVESFIMDYPTFDKGGVYWNGAMHWAPSYDGHLYFQIEDERLQTLPLPAEMTDRSYTMYIGESRGHLHLVVTKNEEHYNRLHVNVYEMSSDHSGWFVKYQVELEELAGAFPKMITKSGCSFDVLDVVRGEKEEDSFMVLMVPRNIITYNVHNRGYKQISKIDDDDFYYHDFPNFHRYIESLTNF